MEIIITGDKEVVAAFTRVKDGAKPTMRRAARKAGKAIVDGQRERLRASGKVDRGESGGLLGAIAFKVEESGDDITVRAGPRVKGESHVPEDIVIEEGRTPGKAMPPSGVLLDWMSRHGIPAEAEFPVRRAIGVRGLSGQPFPYVEPSESEWNAIAEEVGMEFVTLLERLDR